MRRLKRDQGNEGKKNATKVMQKLKNDLKKYILGIESSIENRQQRNKNN